MKILSVGAELFHTDRRTDMTKLTVAFRNFSNAPKKKTLTVNLMCLSTGKFVFEYRVNS